MTTSSASRAAHEQRVLRRCLGALVALVVLKFFVILADVDWELGMSPYGLVVVVVVPALLLAWLVDRRPRAASLLIAVAMLLLILTIILALLRDGLAREAWADYPVTYGGMAIALIGIYSSARLWQSRDHPDAPVPVR